MRLLVTGASGLIGSHVAAAASADRSIALIVTSRRKPASSPANATFIVADLTKPDVAEAVVREAKPTHIVHTAWETAHPTYWEDSSNLRWVASAISMAEAFAATGGERFIQLGSCAEYDWSHGLCREGHTPDVPRTRYGRAKLAAFRAVEAAAQGAFEAAEARIFFVHGPGENPLRFIPYVCRSHLRGEIPQLGDGQQWRDVLHAADAARALLCLAAAAGACGSFNIGSGLPTSLAEVAILLAEIAGADETGLGLRPPRADDPALLIAASDRIRALGWSPRLSLPEALERTFRWWQDSEGGR